MKKQLLIIATLDTKGRETKYIKDCVAKLGAYPVVMDIAVVGNPLIQPDITNRELAGVTGCNLEGLIRSHDRPRAMITEYVHA